MLGLVEGWRAGQRGPCRVSKEKGRRRGGRGGGSWRA